MKYGIIGFHGLKIVKNASIILEYIRVWLLPLTMSKKLVISRCILIEEYQNQLREFYCKNNELVSMPSFSDNEVIKGVLLHHKIVPELHNKEKLLLVTTSQEYVKL